MIHFPNKGAVGIPPLPLGFSSGDVEAGGGKGFAIGILEKEGADFSLWNFNFNFSKTLFERAPVACKFFFKSRFDDGFKMLIGLF